MVKLVISGIAGRMGKRIAFLASKDKEIEITGGIESADNPAVGQGGVASDFAKIASACSVLIEFTFPDVTMKHLEIARKNKVGMVIGTTALSKEQISQIKKASKEIPIVFSPNMSVGANLLFKLTEIASKALDASYKIEIVEAHHAKKKDAPSGTAANISLVVSKVRGETPPIESIREGDIVGDHSVMFTGQNEKIELKHSAFSRDVFAQGALDAAKFIAAKKSGLYTMQDVITT
ncbi:MAG: 4-hydroxy-tetrahydrodipicolinate reductase [Candidatus Gorgyraea atricola]|nr:4-hydroxy-tetrahydrodipicolinate reductase [Candidatus Gorgyraea atricola]